MARKPTPPRATSGAEDYEIGYRRPPKATRWAPGQSGNPSGRPRKKKTLEDYILEVLDRSMVRETPDGKRRRVKTGLVIAERLVGLTGKGVAGAVRPVTAAGTKRSRPEASELAPPFDSEAPLSPEENEIARVAMDYALRAIEDLKDAIDALNEIADEDGEADT